MGVGADSVRSRDWGVRVALVVPETLESFVKKLPHDVTWTMEQASSELCVLQETSVGWTFSATPIALCGGRLHQKPPLGSKSGSGGARDLGKLCKEAAS